MARRSFRPRRSTLSRVTPAIPQVDADMHEKAWRAVREFTKLIPTFTAFARMITGNKNLIVQLSRSGVTETDGKTIWIVPPISMGDNHSHDRKLCDQRDEDRMQMCPACRVREVTLRRLYHEIGHSAGNSFEVPNRFAVDAYINLVTQWHPAKVCNHADNLIWAAESAKHGLALCGGFSPFLADINRSLEDARIDARMYRARPGLRTMFSAVTADTFARGIEGLGSQRIMWTEAPLNAQVIIGLFLLSSGHVIQSGWLSDEAINFLNDPELRTICATVVECESASQAVIPTIRAFVRLNELGLCKVEKCEPQDPAPSMPSNSGDEGEGSADESPDTGTGTGQSEDSPGSGGTSSGTEADSTDGTDPEFDDGESESKPDGGSDRTDGSEDGAEEEEPQSPEDDSVGSDVPGPDEESEGEASDENAGQAGSNTDPTESDEADDSDDESSGPAQSDGSSGTGSEQGESDSSGDTDSRDAQRAQASDAEPELESDSDDDGDRVRPDHEDASAEPGVEETDDELEDRPIGQEVWEEENEEGIPVEIIDAGNPEQVSELLKEFSGHDGHPDEDAEITHDPSDPDERLMAAKAIDLAVSQSSVFDTSSRSLRGLQVITFPHYPFRWRSSSWLNPSDFMVEERTIGPSLLKARLVFSDNLRSKEIRHRKTGRIDASVLGKRAPIGDPRLFKRAIHPGKRSYFIVFGVDCSGSTSQFERMERIKRAIFGKAELVHRLGIPFAIFAHTGGYDSTDLQNYSESQPNEVWMLQIKGPDEPWNDAVKNRLATLQPVAENFDGHTLEFYRKQAQQRPETDRIIMYYTDGDMPAANAEEELPILVNEIELCKKNKITLMAVGINTDSPTRFGFDTVRYDDDEDLAKVVDHLGRRLANG